MFHAGQGPEPPPADRTSGGTPETPGMPPSMLSQQGEKANKTDQNNMADLSKKTVEMAVTKLMEVKNAMDGLNTALKTIDPTSDALMVPMLAAWQGAASKVKEVLARASAGQPNMAGQQPGGSVPGAPGGAVGPMAGQTGPMGQSAAGI
jgi:hypothetical protein